MRISVEANDPGLISFMEATKYEITFNGDIVEYVMTADSDKGYLRVMRHPLEADSEGNIICNDYFGNVGIRRVRP